MLRWQFLASNWVQQLHSAALNVAVVSQDHACKGCTRQAALERRDLSCMNLAHHKLETIIIIIIITITIIIIIIII